jgi:hypothetical protein
MKHRPILFSTAMVQAILDGRKTQTRRVVKGNPDMIGYARITSVPNGVFEDMAGKPIKCPYGQPGDVLWVRETWAHTKQLNINPEDENYDYVHKAGSEDWESFEGWRWKPSIHMPREAARLFLRIKSVRVERLQEISNDDIRAEGAAEFGCTTHRLNWQTLWQSINGPESWDANPWVWVVEFERITREEAGL